MLADATGEDEHVQASKHGCVRRHDLANRGAEYVDGKASFFVAGLHRGFKIAHICLPARESLESRGAVE